MKNKKFISRFHKTANVFDRKTNFTKIFNLIDKKLENATEQDFFEFYYQKFTKNKFFIASRDLFNYFFMVKNKYTKCNCTFFEK